MSKKPAASKALNTSGKKHSFSKAWMHEHVNDPYVQEAKRARLPFARRVQAARDRRTRQAAPARHARRRPGRRARQLVARCCAQKLGPQGADRRRSTCCAMEPMSRRDDSCRATSPDDEGLARASRTRSAGRNVDLVVSDMAPNLSGIAPRRPGARRAPGRTGAANSPSHWLAAGRRPRWSRCSRATGSTSYVQVGAAAFRTRCMSASPRRRATAAARYSSSARASTGAATRSRAIPRTPADAGAAQPRLHMQMPAGPGRLESSFPPPMLVGTCFAGFPARGRAGSLHDRRPPQGVVLEQPAQEHRIWLVIGLVILTVVKQFDARQTTQRHRCRTPNSWTRPRPARSSRRRSRAARSSWIVDDKKQLRHLQPRRHLDGGRPRQVRRQGRGQARGRADRSSRRSSSRGSRCCC